jgi:hypothetical protein
MRDTHTYEREAIAAWLAKNTISPFDRALKLSMTKAILNFTLKQIINEWLECFTFPVKSKWGRTIPLTLKLTNKVIDLKEKVSEQTGEPVGGMKFFYDEIALEDEQTVEDYEFQTGAIVHEPFLVSVKSKWGRTINVTLKFADKVIDLKEKVSEQTGDRAEDMRFISDNKMVEDCGLHAGEIVRDPFQVFCKFVDGRTLLIPDVRLDDSVDSLIRNILVKTGIDIDRVYFVCRLRVLTKGRTLEECGVPQCSMLLQLFRLR